LTEHIDDPEVVNALINEILGNSKRTLQHSWRKISTYSIDVAADLKNSSNSLIRDIDTAIVEQFAVDTDSNFEEVLLKEPVLKTPAKMYTTPNNKRAKRSHSQYVTDNHTNGRAEFQQPPSSANRDVRGDFWNDHNSMTSIPRNVSIMTSHSAARSQPFLPSPSMQSSTRSAQNVSLYHYDLARGAVNGEMDPIQTVMMTYTRYITVQGFTSVDNLIAVRIRSTYSQSFTI